MIEYPDQCTSLCDCGDNDEMVLMHTCHSAHKSTACHDNIQVSYLQCFDAVGWAAERASDL